ncbi:hypothetical protein V8C40DRAFT_217732 [Trichoderma camerunense]
MPSPGCSNRKYGNIDGQPTLLDWKKGLFHPNATVLVVLVGFFKRPDLMKWPLLSHFPARPSTLLLPINPICLFPARLSITTQTTANTTLTLTLPLHYRVNNELDLTCIPPITTTPYDLPHVCMCIPAPRKIISKCNSTEHRAYIHTHTHHHHQYHISTSDSCYLSRLIVSSCKRAKGRKKTHCSSPIYFLFINFTRLPFPLPRHFRHPRPLLFLCIFGA